MPTPSKHKQKSKQLNKKQTKEKIVNPKIKKSVTTDTVLVQKEESVSKYEIKNLQLRLYQKISPLYVRRNDICTFRLYPKLEMV